MKRPSYLFTLNTVQFLAAINENLFKLLAAYFLIKLLPSKNSSSIMEIIGALFILPFLVFSCVGGILADKFPKKSIFIFTRFLELFCFLAAFLLFQIQHPWAIYSLVFLLATTSALFSPSKYAFIPEISTKKTLLYANSIIAAYTYIGIILGTALPTTILQTFDDNFALAILPSVIMTLGGLLLCVYLPFNPPKTSHQPSLFIYKEIWLGLKDLWKVPYLFSAAFSYAYFLFVGSFIQLNIIPYTIEILKLKDLYGGYLFLTTACGLGIGAFTCSFCFKGIPLKEIPISGLCISLILTLFWLMPYTFWCTFFLMFLLGIAGGIFLVPPQSYVLQASNPKSKGRNFATTNFFSFVFALFAALSLYVFNSLLKLNPAQSFLMLGVLQIFFMFCLFFSFKNYTSVKK